VRIDDGVQTRLELLAVLPSGEMAELLAAELLPLGFERDGKIMRRTGSDGVAVEIDLETGTVTARLGAEAEVSADVTLSTNADRNDPSPDRARLEAQVGEALERELDSEARRISGEVAEKLERSLRDLRAELDPATNRATAEALKRRAAQLGQIKEVSENPETGELTIVVEV
jgi:hypothetical protein